MAIPINVLMIGNHFQIYDNLKPISKFDKN